MSNQAIQIISFDVPYPPNYGGVIDVFYKVKALKELGVKVYLHCFVDDRERIDFLGNICEEVYYYKRRKSIINFFSGTPFIVKSRTDKELLQNIKTVNKPILFEGLHTTSILKYDALNGIKKGIRMHNIEHLYYSGLYKSETNIFKKLFFWFESMKLKNYESIIKKVDAVFTISLREQNYYKALIKNAHYLPVFHRNKEFVSYENQGDYILFHGDLRVADNIKSALYLIKIFKELTVYSLVIASGFMNNKIMDAIKDNKNISFVKIEDSEHLDLIFKSTRLHITLSFQNTGIKLKLINALYQGRHVIVNKTVVEGTGLEKICHVFKDKQELISKVEELYTLKFTKEERLRRVEILREFEVLLNANILVGLLN